MEMQVIQGFKIDNKSLVSVKKMQHIYEICYCEHRNTKSYIQLIDKDNYVYLPTGEVKICNHINNRSESKSQVSQSLKRLREYINTNINDPNNCKWITLTYAENMTDDKRLYKDVEKFIKKCRYKYGHFEYITACEPQGRGAWHCHCIFIFDKKAPYIPNKELSKIWGNGFTKTQKLANVDNIGAYLTAYLGDMELADCERNNISYNKSDVKIVDEIDGKKLKTSKKFVKGARLSMYPPNFNIYRISRGIKKPIKEYCFYHEIKEKAGLTIPTYSKTISLTDIENNFTNKIVYEYYNTKRK